MCDRDRFFGKNPLESKMTKMIKNDLKTEFLGSLSDSIDVGQDNQKFSIKIEHIEEHFLIVIFGPSTAIKKKDNPLLSLIII